MKIEPGARRESPSLPFDHEALLELAEKCMPYGKHAGTRLIDLPEPYVVWFAGQGFPPGRLGRLLQAVYEIKVNGLEYLFEPLREGGCHGRGNVP